MQQVNAVCMINSKRKRMITKYKMDNYKVNKRMLVCNSTNWTKIDLSNQRNKVKVVLNKSYKNLLFSKHENA